MTEIATREEKEVISKASSARIGASFFIRVALTATALVIWFWSQKLIGNRGAPAMAIGDRLQDLTAPANLYLHAHASAANLLLIVSSGIIDLLGIFLLARWIFGAFFRPFLGLVIVLGLRQIIQSLVALPAPPDSIWHYPGFPSLLVTYSVSNDYFFSGHTANAVLAVTEIARLRNSLAHRTRHPDRSFRIRDRVSPQSPLHDGRLHWHSHGSVRCLPGWLYFSGTKSFPNRRRSLNCTRERFTAMLQTGTQTFPPQIEIRVLGTTIEHGCN